MYALQSTRRVIFISCFFELVSLLRSLSVVKHHLSEPSVPPAMHINDFSTYLFVFAGIYGAISLLWHLASGIRQLTHLCWSLATRSATTGRTGVLGTEPFGPCSRIVITKNECAHFKYINCGALATAKSSDCKEFPFCKNCKKYCKKHL